MRRYGKCGLLLAFVALVALGAVPAGAQASDRTQEAPAPQALPGGGGQPSRPGRKVEQEGLRAQGVRALLRRLNLSPAELDRIEAVLAKDETALAKDRADIKVVQAQTARILVDSDPSMDALGKAVKQSLDLEYQVRMIQIGRQLEVRKILGDERWATLLRFSRLAVNAQRMGRLGEDFIPKGLSLQEAQAWTRILSYSRRILP